MIHWLARAVWCQIISTEGQRRQTTRWLPGPFDGIRPPRRVAISTHAISRIFPTVQTAYEACTPVAAAKHSPATSAVHLSVEPRWQVRIGSPRFLRPADTNSDRTALESCLRKTNGICWVAEDETHAAPTPERLLAEAA